MPIFNLVLFARTQNVQSIHIAKQYIWLASIKCTSCNEAFPKEVGISLSEQVEMEKQHGTCNFSAKCKNCDRKCFITILPTSSYKAEPNEDGLVKEVLASFECRGAEIVDVVLKDQFTVKIKDSATIVQEADFSDLWAEYDDTISGLAQVEEAKFDLVRSKDK